MDNQHKKHYEYIKHVSTNADVNKELLELFSIFIGQNPAFKYNITYLLDSIDDFQEKSKIFKNKESLIKDCIGKLPDFVNTKCVIIFDNVFVIDERNFYYLIDVINNYSGLDKYLNKFNLFMLSSNTVSLRLLFKLVNANKKQNTKEKSHNKSIEFGKEYFRIIKYNDKTTENIINFLSIIEHIINAESLDE